MTLDIALVLALLAVALVLFISLSSRPGRPASLRPSPPAESPSRNGWANCPPPWGNDLELLRNGEEIFPSLLNRSAKSRPCSDATLATPALPRLRNLKSAGSGCDSRCAWLASSPQSSEWADSIQHKSLRDTHL